MVVTRELQFCFGGVLRYLHTTQQHASARPTYASCLRGERDMCNLHIEHGSDVLTAMMFWWK